MIQTRENYRKPQIWVILGPFAPIMGWENFFSKIGLRHFHRFIEGYLDAKNKKKLMMGSIRTFVTDRQTDRRSSSHRTRRMARVQKMQIFGLAFIVYLMKWSDGSGFWSSYMSFSILSFFLFKKSLN